MAHDATVGRARPSVKVFAAIQSEIFAAIQSEINDCAFLVAVASDRSPALGERRYNLCRSV